MDIIEFGLIFFIGLSVFTSFLAYYYILKYYKEVVK